MWKFLRPAAHKPELPAEAVEREYPRLRRQVFWGIFIGYAGYYLVRKNFSIAMPALESLGYDKADLGWALSAVSIAYGISKFVMGTVSDRSNARIFIPLGLIAGYFRGAAESIIMRTADAFMSFPSMVLILVLVAVFGPSILTVTVVIGILGWTAIAKLIYGNVLSIREREYIQAAKTSGTSTWTILFSEVLPNAIPPVWANISFRVAGAILTESSLSFLGMGVQTPQASWGNIIYAAQNLMVLTARPWVWIPPGVCIILVVIGFNFIGEGVRDALDPKTK